MDNSKQRRIYDRKYKEEALGLVLEEDLKAAEVERDLLGGKLMFSSYLLELSLTLSPFQHKVTASRLCD